MLGLLGRAVLYKSEKVLKELMKKNLSCFTQSSLLAYLTHSPFRSSQYLLLEQVKYSKIAAFENKF